MNNENNQDNQIAQQLLDSYFKRFKDPYNLPDDNSIFNNGDNIIANNNVPHLSKREINNYIPTPLINPDTQQTQPLNNTQFNVDNSDKSLLGKLADGLNDVKTGYQENKYNGFLPQNLLPNNGQINSNAIPVSNVTNAISSNNINANNDNNILPTNNVNTYSDPNQNHDGVMKLIGEAAGTTNRVLTNPIAQGLIGAILTGVVTKNPMMAAGSFMNLASKKQMSDIYTNALRDNGINIEPTVTGDLNQASFQNLMQPKYKKDQLDKDYYDINERAKYHDNDIKIKQQVANDNGEFKRGSLGVQKQRAKTYGQSVNNQYALGKERNGNTASKNAFAVKKYNDATARKSEYNKNLSVYYNLNPVQRAKVKSVMIKQYGNQFIKDSKELEKGSSNIPVGYRG